VELGWKDPILPQLLCNISVQTSHRIYPSKAPASQYNLDVFVGWVVFLSSLLELLADDSTAGQRFNVSVSL